MQRKIRIGLIAMLSLILILPLSLHAAVVGHFTQVRGQVDLLKDGKIPAIPAKLRDGVESGDIIRTKAKARAELTMVDDSVIVIAPESRLAVADYTYNPTRNERRAVIRVFRGLVHTVVKRIIQTAVPDFIMETHTAALGVRGTDWYTLLAPSFTSVYLARGTLGVSSNLSSIPALVLLHSMQFTQVPMGKQPFMAKPMTPEMIAILERLMDTGLVAGGLLGAQGPALPEAAQNLQLPGFPTIQEQRLRQEYIPPVLQPQQQTPAHPGPSGPSFSVP